VRDCGARVRAPSKPLDDQATMSAGIAGISMQIGGRFHNG